jgi:4-hydroxy-tetrahydrodipicolinate synthase
MFSGLSAFPLTPMNESDIDEAAFVRLIECLATAGVDAIGVLGSTGNYAYLSPSERARIVQLAVQHAGSIPVMVGISALRTRSVLELAEEAQQLGARALLLAPMSYQKLCADEVFALYQRVTAAVSVPLCVYDNPGTTHFEFSDELHAEIAKLPQVASIKIPGVPQDAHAAQQRVERLRSLLPADVTIGVSGDSFAATGLLAGCDGWYSVMGGLFPQTALAITRAARQGKPQEALRWSAQLQPIWQLFAQHGSLRVIATAAELTGRVAVPCLPHPLMTLQGESRQRLVVLLDELNLS